MVLCLQQGQNTVVCAYDLQGNEAEGWRFNQATETSHHELGEPFTNQQFLCECLERLQAEALPYWVCVRGEEYVKNTKGAHQQ